MAPVGSGQVLVFAPSLAGGGLGWGPHYSASVLHLEIYNWCYAADLWCIAWRGAKRWVD